MFLQSFILAEIQNYYQPASATPIGITLWRAPYYIGFTAIVNLTAASNYVLGASPFFNNQTIVINPDFLFYMPTVNLQLSTGDKTVWPTDPLP